jgi:hypothetical protein
LRDQCARRAKWAGTQAFTHLALIDAVMLLIDLEATQTAGD